MSWTPGLTRSDRAARRQRFIEHAKRGGRLQAVAALHGLSYNYARRVLREAGFSRKVGRPACE